jgi:phage protein D
MELTREIYINGSSSPLATGRLAAFVIEDNAGLQLDGLELSINNFDNAINIPNSKAVVEIALGYDTVYKMGQFIAQDISATRNSINIKAISQDLSIGRLRQNRVYKNITLEDMLKTIASDLNLTLQLDSSLNTQVDYYLQENKASLEILAELAEIFYAVANVKDKNLVFVSKENTKKLEIDVDNILGIVKQGSSSKVYNGVVYNG